MPAVLGAVHKPNRGVHFLRLNKHIAAVHAKRRGGKDAPFSHYRTAINKPPNTPKIPIFAAVIIDVVADV